EAPGSPPAVYGELVSPGAPRTVILYAHYDGQPVDTARWATPPWRPVLRDKSLPEGGREIPFPTEGGGARSDPEWRIYARSAGDDKASIIAILAALDALRALGVRPSVNLKFFFEGEEEAGSEHLRDMLTRHTALLAADLFLVGDGPVHQTRRPQITFGVRGVMGLQLTVYGAIRLRGLKCDRPWGDRLPRLAAGAGSAARAGPRAGRESHPATGVLHRPGRSRFDYPEVPSADSEAALGRGVPRLTNPARPAGV